MICFAWCGLPQYAARCIAAFARTTKERVVVVATRPVVPIEGMEQIIPGGVIWVEGNGTKTLRELLGAEPSVLIVSGWAIPQFNLLSDEVRKSGGRVFAMSDGNVASKIVAFLRTVRFRLLLSNKYDGFLVPGEAGRRLFQSFGVPSERIAMGMYAADDTLFYDGLPLPARPKRMVFVGRFHPVKNALRMCEAFMMSKIAESGWTLDLYGCGELQDQLDAYAAKCPAIRVHAFLQPEELADAYRESRVFILPSVKEPWGLVVHEAALSGCVLLLSDKVGAAADLLTAKNGIAFQPKSIFDIASAISMAAQMSSKELLVAQKESVRVARENVGVNHFVDGVNRLIGLRGIEGV